METSRACSCYLGVRIFLLLFFIPNKGVALINLRDKYVSQSSNASSVDSFANWAVDGDIDTFSHTLCSGDQWWRVDLGTTYRLQRITLVNRKGRHGGRLRGAIVRAGLDADHSQNAPIGSPVNYGQANPGGQTLDFEPDPVVAARYVSVDNTCLQLAEVRLEEEVIISSGELVDFTCFNSNPLLPITTEGTYIGGYKGNVALLGDAVTFGRTVSTATGDGLPSCSCIPNPGDGRGTAIVRQHMNCPNGFCSCGGTGSSCLYRIGAFYCQIDTGTTVERITAITLNSNAVIIPKRQTITVSEGESLTLHVTTTLSPPPDWRWRKTSVSFNNWLLDWVGVQSPTISSVSEADAGVYECHVHQQRGQGRHAIFRVIVRGCPRNMWGPSTGCQNVCPVCYNGGMCHDVTGQCICAPGFSGSNCHIANGRNAWGLNGTLSCTGAEDRHGASCRGRQFCLQDPFGCSCAAGYKGIGCDQECDEPNTFGPYCSQTCHCADGITCLTDTGECNDPSCTDDYCPQRCVSGWKGRNCQVETPCPLGYYGEICTQRCNCRDNQACNEETGDCVNGCADGYIGTACDQAPSEPPQNVINTAKLKRGLRFAWQLPPCLDCRGDIVGYTYRLIDLERGGVNVTEDTSSSKTDAYIDGLVPYTLYSFQVLARTAAGDGLYSDAIKLRTDQAQPPQITSVTTPSGDVTSITVQWPRPDPPNGIIIAYYVVYGIVSRVNQTLQVTEGLNDTIVQVELTGLVSESNYSIQIQAETVVNRGSLSEPIYRIIRYRDTYPPVFTANSCPSPIYRVAEPRSMITMVTWNDPTATDSSDVAPTVQCTPASGTIFMIGQTPVTCTATDADGNKATPDCTFTVTVTVPAKLLPPVVSDNSTTHITETTIKLRIAPVSQRNGPVSCVEVTVIRLTDEEGIEGKDPDVLYHPDLLRSFDKAQESTGLPYVAMVFKANDLSESVEIEIGSGGESSCGGSRRKKRQTPPSHSGENGPLIPETKYTAFVRAYVILDNQMEDYITSPLLKPVWTDPSGTENTAVIAVVSVVSTTLIIALIACGVRVWIRRKKRRNKYSPPKRTSMKMDRIDYDDGTLPEGGMASTVYEDVGLPSWALRWEILWKNLVVDDKVLGQGNFGEVRSGTVNIGGKKTKTAIKILKGHASKTDREDFMEEFRTMTNIGYHPNVVSLLGACQHEDVLYVSLEYLPNGDLRSYLRTARSQSESDEGALSSEMLIKFAVDVAKGMNHLSVSGVIHRDLAARNILLGEQLVAKVSDFGLSRGEDTYVQTSARRVPTRWLAIESLLDRTYTTQSDVWSFGILLWEIASIGGTPYPAIATRSLVGRLMEGYRMTKPANCDEQIYSLMLRCWEEDPSDRPSFSDLIRILSKMDDNKIEHTYMAIDRAHYENFCVIRPELDDN